MARFIVFAVSAAIIFGCSYAAQTIDDAIDEALKDKHREEVTKLENGDYLVDMDERLTAEQYHTLFGKNKKRSRRAAGLKTKLWPNGILPYAFGDMSFTGDKFKPLNKIMKLISEETCIRFRGKQKTDKDYVLLIDGGGCYSMLGKIGREQKLSLSDPGCRWEGTIYHELLHALGIIHEQEREDRDDHITVDYDNIVSQGKSQFEKVKPGVTTNEGVPYDFSSVMHYSLRSFAKDDSKMTMIPKNERYAERYLGDLVGNRPVASFGDVKLVNKLYQCGGYCKNVDCPEPGFVNKECKCIQKKDYARKYCVGTEMASWCFKYRMEKKNGGVVGGRGKTGSDKCDKCAGGMRPLDCRTKCWPGDCRLRDCQRLGM